MKPLLILFFLFLPPSAKAIEVIPVKNISGTEAEFNIRVQSKLNDFDEEKAVRIAKCESGLNPLAKNPNSSASGLFQFTTPTWKYIKAESHQFNAEENIKQFIKWYKIRPEWWVCQ